MRLFDSREQWLDYVSAQASKVLADAGYLGPTTDFVEIRSFIAHAIDLLGRNNEWGETVSQGGVRVACYSYDNEDLTDFQVSIDIGYLSMYDSDQEDGVVMGVENGPDDYSMV